MQAADIAIGLRRRSPWEAMDLGLTMLQRWGRQVYLPHVLFAVPLMAAAIAAGWWFERAWVALLAIWWMKPAYDRVVLHVLSRAVFGELPSTRAVFGAAKDWLRTGLLTALLLRLWPDTSRSFTLPVRQLEGQSGRAGRERRAVLGRRIGSYATWLTLTCLAIEILVLTGSFGLITELFLPAKASEGGGLLELVFGNSEETETVFGFDDALAYAAAVLVLEPFYVAAGFGLYLNRRTMLEGWDIEVALRSIAARHAAVLVFVIGMAAALMPFQSYAQEKEPKQEITKVLEAKEFGYYRDVKRWQSRERDSQGKDLDLGWLRGVGYALAKAGEVLMWIAAGVLLAYALWWASRMLPRWRAAAPEPYRPPAALFGMDLAPENLPPDVGAAAAALAREGKLREALGLLYRGSLSELVHKRGVRLLPSHTEGEAVTLANIAYFSMLVHAWQSCAYASRVPPADEIERLAADYGKAFA